MSATILDTNIFKISSDGRNVQDAIGIVNGKRISIKVKVNPEGDVWEYVSWVPAEFIGQQLFTYVAALRETQKAGKSLPEDQATFEQILSTMPGDTGIKQYKNYLESSKTKYAGCFSSWSHIFDDVWMRAYYRLNDGSRLALSPTTWMAARRDESMWYSVRCF